MTWDVTVADTLAISYTSASASTAGAVAEAAASRKRVKYTDIATSHIFIPIAIETMGPLCSEATEFIVELGRRLSVATGDPREPTFLFQRLSILIQRYNAVAFRGSFIEDTLDS